MEEITQHTPTPTFIPPTPTPSPTPNNEDIYNIPTE